jgi:predicted aspartyl protease
LHVKLGTFSVEAAVFRVGMPIPSIRVSLVADTGATFTTFPASALRKLGVEPERSMKVRLADGSVVERSVGYAGLELVGEGRSLRSTPVIFGDEGVYLLGAVTLRELSLAADPLHRRLVPAEGLLLSVGGSMPI